MTILYRGTPTGEILDANGRVIGKVVPVEPQRTMLNAAIDAHGHKLCEISRLGFRMSPQMMFEKSYSAMLAAATLDLSGAVVRVPKRQLATVHKESHLGHAIDSWNACLDALGVGE